MTAEHLPPTNGSNVLDFNTAARAGELKGATLSAVDWEIRLARLRDALAGRAEDLVRDIFPRALIHRGEARIGSVAGERGESLAIQTQGDKAGLWTDHATGEGGDLIDLWRATQGYTGQGGFTAAVDDLERWAGLAAAPAWTSPVRKVATARAAEAAREPKPDPAQAALGAPVQTWHYYSADGSILGKVSKYLLANGEKTYRPFNAQGEMRPPDPRPLYRIPDIRTANTVILTEGEKCADALASIGFEATSAMGGANALIEKTDWSPLAGKTVLLWPDNDAPGYDFMARVAPALEAIGCAVSVIEPGPGRPDKWDAADAVAAGEDVAQIIGPVAPPTKPTSPALRFRFLTIDELSKVAPPEWRIDGIFPTHGSSTIYGAYESYKSFVGLDMLLSLAAGRPWFEREIKPCPVLYIVGEGQYGVAPRVLGWCAERNGGAWPAHFLALPEALSIPSPGDMDDLLRAIDAMPEPPGVVALDTITRMSGGGSLNDEKDVQAYVRGMDRLRLHTGGHVMNIGHTGKDREKGLLGSIVLPAAMETIICCERRGDAVKLINSNPKGKQKDGPHFEDIALRGQVVHFDWAGRDTTTILLMPDEAVVDEDGKKSEPTQRLGSLEKRILAALEQAARQDQVLGFQRLIGMVGGDSGNIGRAVRKLIEKDLIAEIEEEGRKSWKLL